ncbi:hypothetical protein VISI1226_15471 [Vibrio sinaloensis DSM 21326]|uniref:Uncharacterized protein n=1 Tax=Vibrio sinaloensis DSM 21326 TaxID=945550 RepID=E8MCX7_PHOS4|nr:hypothetical protein VISI1226_15471 [Vibrio sinaloensis DSM 21326]
MRVSNILVPQRLVVLFRALKCNLITQKTTIWIHLKRKTVKRPISDNDLYQVEEGKEWTKLSQKPANSGKK